MKTVRYLVVAVALLVLVPLFFAVNAAREAARQSSCQGHLNQLQLALRNYEADNGHFPPAYVLGPDGTPWHSWRVLLLPYLGYEKVYEQYSFDEPWNGPNNRKLADKVFVENLQCPSGTNDRRSFHTNYVVVVGEETAFPGINTTKSADITDGAANTILVLEVGGADIHWMEPRDLEYDSLTFQATPEAASFESVSSPHPAGPAVVFADGITAYRLRLPFSLSTLRALLTISGNENVSRDELEKWDDTNGRYLSETSQ